MLDGKEISSVSLMFVKNLEVYEEQWCLRGTSVSVSSVDTGGGLRYLLQALILLQSYELLESSDRCGKFQRLWKAPMVVSSYDNGGKLQCWLVISLSLQSYDILKEL